MEEKSIRPKVSSQLGNSHLVSLSSIIWENVLPFTPPHTESAWKLLLENSGTDPSAVCYPSNPTKSHNILIKRRYRKKILIPLSTLSFICISNNEVCSAIPSQGSPYDKNGIPHYPVAITAVLPCVCRTLAGFTHGSSWVHSDGVFLPPQWLKNSLARSDYLRLVSDISQMFID